MKIEESYGRLEMPTPPASRCRLIEHRRIVKEGMREKKPCQRRLVFDHRLRRHARTLVAHPSSWPSQSLRSRSMRSPPPNTSSGALIAFIFGIITHPRFWFKHGPPYA